LKLVIVESPNKVRKIKDFLRTDYPARGCGTTLSFRVRPRRASRPVPKDGDFENKKSSN